MRKKNEILRESLLDGARMIAETQGLAAVNIRMIALHANVSIGTVYNYFSDKDDILLALTEEYWEKALVEMRIVITSDSFHKQLKEMYTFLYSNIFSSAGNLMHSLVNVMDTARNRMQLMQDLLREDIIQRITLDDNILLNIWDEEFTKVRYAQWIIMNMMIHLQMKSSQIDFLIEIVKRTIY